MHQETVLLVSSISHCYVQWLQSIGSTQHSIQIMSHTAQGCDVLCLKSQQITSHIYIKKQLYSTSKLNILQTWSCRASRRHCYVQWLQSIGSTQHTEYVTYSRGLWCALSKVTTNYKPYFPDSIRFLKIRLIANQIVGTLV